MNAEHSTPKATNKSTPKRTKSRGKKNFVLDTNVILHDFECIDRFQENDIYIPIVVLEELDRFKKGSEQINFNARAFIRTIDKLSDDFITKGASLGEGRGKLFIVLEKHVNHKVMEAFPGKIADNRILSIALNIAQDQPDTPTILVTKDVNLRVKARSLGMPVEDYYSDKIEDINVLDNKGEVIENVPSEIIDSIYANQKNGIQADTLKTEQPLVPNDCMILKSDRNSVMVRFDPFNNTIRAIQKQTCSGITARNAEQSFALDVLMDPNIKLVGLTGKAGTGKTLLALAAALEQKETYSQILLSRPIVALSNKDLGFLPGDEKQKISPYMQPLFDNLNFIKSLMKKDSNSVRELDQMQQDQTLVIEALAYIRGRSLSGSLLIVDEAQNLTPHEIKTIVTRAGEGTKVVFTGDIEQIDSPYLDARSNGLAYMIEKMSGQELFAHVNLIKGERSQLSELASNLL